MTEAICGKNKKEHQCVWNRQQERPGRESGERRGKGEVEIGSLMIGQSTAKKGKLAGAANSF